MNYKEKHEQALERAKNLHKDAIDMEESLLAKQCEIIFPELKSEDERVRKWLLGFVQGLPDEGLGFHFYNLNKEQVIAWLEKQKDTNVLIHEASERAYTEGMRVERKHWLEKQGDKDKLTEKVEPKFKVKYAGSEYNVLEVKDIAGVTFYGIGDEPNHIDYVQAANCERVDGYNIKENGSTYPTKSAMFSEQKTAWSEEDSKMFNTCCDFLTDEECVWLQSLRTRLGGK